MRYAFHFHDQGDGWYKYDEALFKSLLQQSFRCHVQIQRGNVIIHDRDPLGGICDSSESFTDSVGLARLSRNEYVNIFENSRPYVQIVHGLTNSQASRIAQAISTSDGYLGMIPVRFNSNLYNFVYRARLIPSYRVIGSELRLQHTAFDVVDEDLRDVSMFDYWRRSEVFDRVVWENVGVRSSILDSFDSLDHDSIVGETEALLEDLLENVSNEVMIRAIDLDPRLVEALHAALDGLYRARTSEQLSQCALSCRRFLERLADRLFPATDETRGDRELGQNQWKNRLWAYVEDVIGSKAASTIDARLDEIGSRIDSVSDAAQSDVHRPEVVQVSIIRLIIGLLSLVYDLTLLDPPPTELPGHSYERGASEIILGMIGHDR